LLQAELKAKQEKEKKETEEKQKKEKEEVILYFDVIGFKVMGKFRIG